MREHFRFKGKIIKIEGDILTLKTFKYKAGAIKNVIKEGNKVKVEREPYVEEPEIIPNKFVGKKVRCVI